MFDGRLIGMFVTKKYWQKNVFDFIPENSSITLICFFVGICTPLLQKELVNSLLILLYLLPCVALIFLCKKYQSMLIFFVSFLLGLFWSCYSFESHQKSILPSELESQSIRLSGFINGLPSVREGTVSFAFKVEVSDQIVPNKGDLIKLSCYQCDLDLKSNEHWQLTVRLKQPHGYASWGAFDYEKYLFRHRYVAKGYVRLNERNTQLQKTEFSTDKLRHSILSKLRNTDSLSLPGVAIMTALMIGDKSMMSAEQSQVFQKTGVSHLMAISGLHIGLVFISIAWLCRLLSYPFARIYLLVPRQHLVFIPALLGALFYASLAGFAASTTRAVIMLFVFVFCKLLVREVSLHKVLLVAACLIVLIDPFSVLDIGFWLSCSAVWVIALVSNSDKPLSLLRLQPLLWLGMVPMTVLFFGQISWVSPFINLIFVPLFCLALIPITLISMCLLVLGLDNAGFFVLFYLDYVYEFLYCVLSHIARYELANTTTHAWSYWQTSLLIISLLLYFLRMKVIASCVWLIMFLSLFFSIPHFFKENSMTELEVVLLDVGQGLSMVVHVRGKQDYNLVYDTGPRYPSGFSAAKAVLIPYLESRSISHIDRLIISHADNDHIGGYKDLTEELSVGDIITSRTDVLPQAGRCLAGQSWYVGNIFFEILSPTSETPKGSNNLSCVLKINNGYTSVLITGDIEEPVERFLLKYYKNDLQRLKADILLVPHQGSKTSSTQNFIDAVRPEIALVAAGYLNHYGHPHSKIVARYEDRGINLLSTVDNGSVIIKINEQGWRKVAFRDAERRFWNHQKKPNLPR